MDNKDHIIKTLLQDISLIRGELTNMYSLLETGNITQGSASDSLPPAGFASVILTAFHQCPLAIVITDSKGLIEYVNPRYTVATGYEQSELLGTRPPILTPEFHNNNTYEALWKTIRAGVQWRGEFEDKKKSGNPLWQNVLITPLKEKSAIVTHFLIFAEDINSIKFSQ